MFNDPIKKTEYLLDLVARSQQVTGSNISNVHTPGYVKQKFDLNHYINNVNGSLETKMSERLGPAPVFTEEEGRVNMSQELLQMQKNLMFYTMSTRRLSSVIQEIKTVSQVGK